MASTPPAAAAEPPRFVKVAVDFRQSGAASREEVRAGGGIVTEQGGRARGRLGAGSTEVRVRRATGVFTLVHDGGESTLVVATQVPHPQVAFYRDYAARTGHLAAGVAFKDVGTSLKVHAKIVGGDRIRVRLTPTISYFAADRSGAIEFTEASTELIVRDGQPVVLGGGSTELHEVLRWIFGVGERRETSATSVVLTATTR